MEINLIKQFINYIESEEVDNIYTLTLDDDNNEIILNQDKYIILLISLSFITKHSL